MAANYLESITANLVVLIRRCKENAEEPSTDETLHAGRLHDAVSGILDAGLEQRGFDVTGIPSAGRHIRKSLSQNQANGNAELKRRDWYSWHCLSGLSRYARWQRWVSERQVKSREMNGALLVNRLVDRLFLFPEVGVAAFLLYYWLAGEAQLLGTIAHVGEPDREAISKEAAEAIRPLFSQLPAHYLIDTVVTPFPPQFIVDVVPRPSLYSSYTEQQWFNVVCCVLFMPNVGQQAYMYCGERREPPRAALSLGDTAALLSMPMPNYGSYPEAPELQLGVIAAHSPLSDRNATAPWMSLELSGMGLEVDDESWKLEDFSTCLPGRSTSGTNISHDLQQTSDGAPLARYNQGPPGDLACHSMAMAADSAPQLHGWKDHVAATGQDEEDQHSLGWLYVSSSTFPSDSARAGLEWT